MTWPNVISLGRFFLVLPSVYLLVRGRYCQAFLIVSIASLSDVLDGFLARCMKASSKTGMYLDPFADKFLLTTLFIVLSLQGYIPSWLTVLVLSRDSLIITGTALLLWLGWKTSFPPHWLGKVATLSQVLIVTALIGQLSLDVVLLGVNKFLFLASAIAAILSGGVYVKIGVMAFRNGNKRLK